MPDFTKISPAQIFNGSVAASLNSMKDIDPFGLSGKKSYDGAEESPWKNTTIDASTGKRVEVRKAQVVQEMLDGGSARKRGFTKVNEKPQSNGGGGGGGGGYAQPEYPDMPSGSDTTPGDNILGPPPPDGSIVEDPSEDGTLFPGVTPEQKKVISLGQLPTLILDELKKLNMLP